MAKLEKDSRKKIYCNTCKGKTHHEMKAMHSKTEYELENEGTPFEQPIYDENHEYRLWVCLGCETGTLEIAYNDTGMFDPLNNRLVWAYSLHPRRKARDLQKKTFLQLNNKLANIYNQVIESYNFDLRILCAIGLRALLEGICAEKEITKGNLDKKIDKLVDHLPPNIVESLHSFRFMGNIAAHQLEAPSSYELKLAIEVMEDLLNFLYELDYKAKKLSKKK